VCLYNLWQLADLKSQIQQDQAIQKDDISAKTFGSTVLRALPLMGTGPPKSQG